MSQCTRTGGYADWRCELDAGHDGDHRDALDRTWEAVAWEPVIAADKITVQIAEKILDQVSPGGYKWGELVIEGVKVGYYASREDVECVWFYNPGDDEDDERIIARFEVERTVVRV